MKRALFIGLLLLLSACRGGDAPEPIELTSLLEEETGAAPEAAPPCRPPIMDLRVNDWQALLDQPLTLEETPGQPVLRRLLRRWIPTSLLEASGPSGASLRINGLTVGVDATGTPGIRALHATLALDMTPGPARDAVIGDLDQRIESLSTLVPGVPSVTTESSDQGITLDLRIGPTRTAPSSTCQPASLKTEHASGIHVRIGIQALLEVVENAAGPLLLWSIIPEELGRWHSLDLSLLADHTDRISLRLDDGDGALTGILEEARFPAQPGWDHFLPPASPVTAGIFLHEAESWTLHLSDLMFEKGFKLDKIDPREILNEDWQSQLGKLLSGPAVGFPIVKKYNLEKWDEGWMVYLQPKNVSELDGRLRRVFSLKQYTIRDETFHKRDLVVVRYKKAGNKVGGVRFAWFCEAAGCWVAKSMTSFDHLFDIEEGAATPQARRIRELMGEDILAFAVLNPRTFGERFYLPKKKEKKKKKKDKDKKKGGLSLPSFGDRDAIARQVVENAIRNALSELPEDLLVSATLRVDQGTLALEVDGFFRLVGRVATKFLPLL